MGNSYFNDDRWIGGSKTAMKGVGQVAKLAAKAEVIGITFAKFTTKLFPLAEWARSRLDQYLDSQFVADCRTIDTKYHTVKDAAEDLVRASNHARDGIARFHKLIATGQSEGSPLGNIAIPYVQRIEDRRRHYYKLLCELRDAMEGLIFHVDDLREMRRGLDRRAEGLGRSFDELQELKTKLIELGKRCSHLERRRW